MNDLNWSKSEKVVARCAFDTAYKKEYGAIIAKLKEMTTKASKPEHIWRIHDYLTEQLKQFNRNYDYRYSVLIFEFARQLKEGWLTLTDLEGLGEEKIEKIKKLASL